MRWRKVGKILLWGMAGSIATLVVLILVVGIALDRVPHYQAEIKDWVHDRTGYHIAFTHVAPVLRWSGPELSFDRLELRSKDDRRVLARAAGGRVGIDVRQLLQNGRWFAARIELDAPTLVIVRTAADKWSLASDIELSGNGDRGALATTRLNDLPAGSLVIRHALITVQNWAPALPELVLRDVNVQLRRVDRSATWAADAQLPALLGGDLSIDGAAHGDGGLGDVAWSTRVSARHLAFVGWRSIMPQYLSRLAGGAGGFEIAARGRGRDLQHADLAFAATDVAVQLTDEPGVTFDQVTGAFTLTHAAEDWTLLGRRVKALRAGHQDPDSEFDVSWRGGPGGLLALRARASYLRAETLLPLAGLLPQQDLRERLQQLAPTGEWLNMRVDLARNVVADPWRLDLQASFRDVGFAPVGRAPGLRGLSGTLMGDQSGGRIDIDTQHGAFTWPMQLSQAVKLDDFKTTLYWKRTPAEFLVATPSIAFRNSDAAFSGRFAWQQPADGGSPVLTLASALDNGDVANTRLYLPRLLISPPALAWLDRAFPAGHLTHADIVIHGPLRHFPFRDGSGRFLARAAIDGTTLDYKDGWPRADHLSMVAEFRNEGLNVQLKSARIGNLTMEGGTARFADFKTGELEVHVAASGDATDALGYLQTSPIDAAAEHVFSGVEAKGPMQATVDLFLPFKNFDQRRTLVHASLRGVALNRLGSPLIATELTGDVDVDGAQVSHADVHGRVLGGSFTMATRAPRNRPVTRTVLVFNGTFSADALHAALSLPANIALSGTSDWHAVLRMAQAPARERTLHLEGSLAGLELNLPQPLQKPAGQALPAAVDVDWLPTGGIDLHVALGSVLRGRATVDSDANGPTLKRLAVTFGSTTSPANVPAFSDAQVVNTGGTIGRLDLAGWLKLYKPGKNGQPLTAFLRTATLNVAQIDYLGLSFRDVAVDLAVNDSGWRIGLGGPNVVGSIVLPGAADPLAPWKLEFSRLKFVDERTAGTDSSLPAAPATTADGPNGIPALQFHATDVIWDERPLGDVAATLKKLDDGISMQQFTMTSATFGASLKGEWRGAGAGVARIEGAINSADVGAALKSFGYDAVIEAKSAKIDFDLSWLGAPTVDALSLATGRVQLALDHGQLPTIKPGAGRVMGLTSLASLPRRLTLDFSDLTDKGLAFDTVRGDFDLHDGSAYTDNVLLKGPAAEIGLIGRVGLKNEDYDQTAVVTGNVSSTLPLAAFAAGPVVGGAVLLFTQVFKQPLQGLARGYYRITGGWGNPLVERIKSGGAAAAMAEAPK